MRTPDSLAACPVAAAAQAASDDGRLLDPHLHCNEQARGPALSPT